jgi:hypothetical protein
MLLLSNVTGYSLPVASVCNLLNQTYRYELYTSLLIVGTGYKYSRYWCPVRVLVYEQWLVVGYVRSYINGLYHCVWCIGSSWAEHKISQLVAISHLICTMAEHKAISYCCYTAPCFWTKKKVLWWSCSVCVRFPSIWTWKFRKLLP